MWFHCKIDYDSKMWHDAVLIARQFWGKEGRNLLASFAIWESTKNLVGMSFLKLQQTKRHLLSKHQLPKLFLDQAFRGVGWSNDDLRRKQLGKVEDCGRFGEGL